MNFLPDSSNVEPRHLAMERQEFRIFRSFVKERFWKKFLIAGSVYMEQGRKLPEGSFAIARFPIKSPIIACASSITHISQVVPPLMDENTIVFVICCHVTSSPHSHPINGGATELRIWNPFRG